MITPQQGPREPMRNRPVTMYQRFAVEEAIATLERVQRGMRETEGDSRERTTVCKALELLYHLTVER